jgi:hypothetical protein
MVAAGDDEVSFQPGDTITNVTVIDDGWWQGECNGKYGVCVGGGGAKVESANVLCGEFRKKAAS